MDLTTPATSTVRLDPERSMALRVASMFGLGEIFPQPRWPASTDECVKALGQDYGRRLIEAGLA